MAKRRITFHPLTPERWPDLLKLFGERGACGGCWCMAWRRKRSDFVKGKGASNKRAFTNIVKRDEQPGVLAYYDGEPIGWCSVAPREVFVALGRSRVLAPVDDTPVWSISCLVVAKPFRRQGVSVQLIDAACKFAASQGATFVEAYPVIPYTDSMPAAFAWTGILTAYKKAGFKEVARRSDARPILRRFV
jgi:GNAT superfamily N-acetyltransferase